MRLTLFIVSIAMFIFTPVCAIFFDAKSGNTSGSGFSIPFWPFVLTLAFLALILAILFPKLADLIALWLRTRVEIAKAEHGQPAEAVETPPEKPPADK